ncbi:hypothetical protein JCM6882_007379 [Rhodosporidiobolus microsporus]
MFRAAPPPHMFSRPPHRRTAPSAALLAAPVAEDLDAPELANNVSTHGRVSGGGDAEHSGASSASTVPKPAQPRAQKKERQPAAGLKARKTATAQASTGKKRAREVLVIEDDDDDDAADARALEHVLKRQNVASASRSSATLASTSSAAGTAPRNFEVEVITLDDDLEDEVELQKEMRDKKGKGKEREAPHTSSSSAPSTSTSDNRALLSSSSASTAAADSAPSAALVPSHPNAHPRFDLDFLSSPPGIARSFQLGNTPAVFDKAASAWRRNDLQLAVPGVEPRHAVFRVEKGNQHEQGVVVHLQNLTENGLWLNGEIAGAEAELRDGDVLIFSHMGDKDKIPIKYTFRCPAPPSGPPRSPCSPPRRATRIQLFLGVYGTSVKPGSPRLADKPWTVEEDRTLLDGVRLGKELSHVAKELGTSDAVVGRRWEDMKKTWVQKGLVPYGFSPSFPTAHYRTSSTPRTRSAPAPAVPFVRPWLPVDDATLRRLAVAGEHVDAIATRLWRSVGELEGRWGEKEKEWIDKGVIAPPDGTGRPRPPCPPNSASSSSAAHPPATSAPPASDVNDLASPHPPPDSVSVPLLAQKQPPAPSSARLARQHAREGSTWSAAEEETLRAGRAASKSFAAIASELGRTESAVEKKWYLHRASWIREGLIPASGQGLIKPSSHHAPPTAAVTPSRPANLPSTAASRAPPPPSSAFPAPSSSASASALAFSLDSPAATVPSFASSPAASFLGDTTSTPASDRKPNVGSGKESSPHGSADKYAASPRHPSEEAVGGKTRRGKGRSSASSSSVPVVATFVLLAPKSRSPTQPPVTAAPPSPDTAAAASSPSLPSRKHPRTPAPPAAPRSGAARVSDEPLRTKRQRVEEDAAIAARAGAGGAEAREGILSTPDFDLVKSKLANAESSVDAQALAGGVAAMNVGGGAAMGGPPPSLPPVQEAKRDVPPVQQQKPQCRAVWDYAKTQPDDLGFKTGDVITIEEEVNADWWKGSFNGQTGLFPSNHVERIAAPPSGARAPPPPPPGGPAYNPGYGAPPPPQNSYGPPSNAPYAYNQPQGYGSEKASYAATPPPAFPQNQYQPPPPPPAQPHYVVQQPAAPLAAATPEEQKKKGRFGGFGNTLAHSAVGGAGFGVGSALTSNAINAIF